MSVIGPALPPLTPTKQNISLPGKEQSIFEFSTPNLLINTRYLVFYPTATHPLHLPPITSKMRAYYYDNAPTDQRLPHDSGLPVPLDILTSLGLLYYNFDTVSEVNSLASSRSYKNRDEVTVSPTSMGPLYESKVKSFFEEHLHEDEEIRYILDGTGYFDVRDDRKEGEGRWIRIEVVKGDLLVLPEGVYHRFTTGEGDYIKAMRLFKEEPKWTPLNRSVDLDGNVHRVGYLKTLE